MLSRLGPRSRYLVVSILTLLPLAVVLSIVAIYSYLPAYRAVDEIAHETVHEILPIHRLQVALMAVAMPPNDYLIHGNPTERDIWREKVGEVEQAFSGALDGVALETTRQTLQALRDEWREARRMGDDLFNFQVRTGDPRAAAHMEAFDARLDAATGRLDALVQSSHQATLAQFAAAHVIEKRGVILAGFSILLGLLLGTGASLVMTRTQETLIKESIIDALTGLYNRRAFGKRLGKIDNQADPHNRRRVAMLIWDIDHFKRVNDAHGHQAGDRVLAAVAMVARKTLREGDFVARYGGEEFAAILPGMDGREAAEVAARLKDMVQRKEVKLRGGGKTGVTISCGVAGYPEDADCADSMLRAADKALYWAKRNGRNAVGVWRRGELHLHG